MAVIETLDDFYRRLELKPPASHTNGKDAGHFNVYPRQGICKSAAPLNRRDFYKISFVIGKGRFHFLDRSVEIDKPVVILSSPHLPYSWEKESDMQEGYFCLFNDAFLNNQHAKDIVHESPLCQPTSNPLFFVDDKQQERLHYLFGLMLCEMESEYLYKHELLRHYLYVMVHEVMKMRATETWIKHSSASARLTASFMELLERQFPIDSPEHILQLRTAQDYAARLNVHVNHLNRAVKEVTGKTTTEHIAERITGEARALLKHANWSVAEIAYSLGFEYPAYFNNFFKKHTSSTPGAFRTSDV